mgnify:CR=1 FL=1
MDASLEIKPQFDGHAHRDRLAILAGGIETPAADRLKRRLLEDALGGAADDALFSDSPGFRHHECQFDEPLDATLAG